MIIYRDAFTGDEMISDSFPHTLIEDNCAMVVKAKSITISNDCGIASNDEEDGGPLADGAETVIDVVHAFRLQECFAFDNKKVFMGYIKKDMTRVKEHLEAKKPDRVEAFMKGAQNIVKDIVANFGEYRFYTGESYDESAALAYSKYEEGSVDPTFLFFLDGMIAEKC